MTEALDNEELKPPSVPFDLLQQLCQAPALIAALQAATPFSDSVLGGGRRVDAVADGHQPLPSCAVYWTARLSVSSAAAEIVASDGASSSNAPDPPGK